MSEMWGHIFKIGEEIGGRGLLPLGVVRGMAAGSMG